MLLYEDSLYFSYSKSELSHWNCPTCIRGILKLQDSNFMSKQSNYSRITPPTAMDTGGVFTGILVCSNEDCQESVIISGKYDVEWRTRKGLRHLERKYRPHFFQPHLHFFNTGEFLNLDQNAWAAIHKAFELFWVDSNSCANKIRVAIEHILTDKGIRKTRTTKKGERIRLTLHDRIELFKSKYPRRSHIADQLMAVKWIGNDGSHADFELDQDTVYVGFRILYDTLQKLYGDAEREIKSMVKRINTRKSSRGL